MAKLVYGTNVSLDGYIEDEEGRFDWTEPNEEVHTFWNDFVRTHGTFLYGRRLYETMAVWETLDADPSQAPYELEFARLWKATDKVVYSTTLEEAATARTRIEREFDPEAVAAMKAGAESDLAIGGADLASDAFEAGLVDEVHLCVVPHVAGGGKPGLPRGAQIPLELLDERRFADGTVYLRYRVGTAG
jgi:dihydrofolate reductase